MTTKYFSETTELQGFRYMKNAAFAAAFPSIAGKRVDSFSKLVGFSDGKALPVTRIIDFKKNPSLHVCDARCRHAKNGNCECSCGGKFHGVGG